MESRPMIPEADVSCRFLTAFFGRAREKVALLSAYENMVNSSHDNLTRKISFVLIKGAAGVGKTWFLEKTLKERVASSGSSGVGAGAYYITCRFDQYLRSQVTRVFDGAFEDFAMQCAARGPSEMALVRRLVRKSSELHLEPMAEAVPSMRRILLSESQPLGEGESEACSSLSQSGRRSELLCGFLRALSQERPVVFVFENWQWAHQTTLETLNRIVRSLKDSRVLFVATYRPDCEPFFQHPSIRESEIDVLFEKMKKNEVGFRQIKLEALQDDGLSDLVSHVLEPNSRPTECQEVTRLVGKAAEGNPSHAVELLRSICESNRLTNDVDTNSLTSKGEGETFRRISTLPVHELLRERVRRLSPNTQKMLTVASVFGCEIKENVLWHAISNTNGPLPLDSYLEEAVTSGVLERNTDHQVPSYRFSSNLVQEAAYSFIDQTGRKGFHVALGRQLWKSMTMDEVNHNLALVLFQINIGTELITSQLERRALASLMYSLGSRVAKDSFTDSAFLLEEALKLLGDDCWREEHDLSLALHNMLAEIKYASGALDRVSLLVKEIVVNARSVDERVEAHCTNLLMLIAANKSHESLAGGLAVLRELGETFSTKPSKQQVKRSYRRINKKLKGRSLEFILRLPTMTDKRKLGCMKIMNLVGSVAYIVDPFLGAMICDRMMELTLEYGSCTITSCVLSVRGMLLCGMEMRVDDAFEYGQLALKMLDKYKTKEFLPRVYDAVYGEINPFSGRPIEESLEPLWKSVVTAMETGDITYGIVNAHVYCSLAFYLGRPLSELKEMLDRVGRDLVTLNHDALLAFNIPILDTVCGLIEGNLVDESSKDCEDYESFPWTWGQMCLRAYVLRDYETAARCGKEFKRLFDPDRPFSDVEDPILSAYASLALMAEQRRDHGHQKLRWRKKPDIAHARSAIKYLDRAATKAPDLLLSKLHLLKAELFALTKKPDKAYRHYTLAIAMGVKTGYLLDEAVASERAGLYMLNGEGSSKKKWAVQKLLEQALDAYKRWGAAAKVQQLESDLLETKQQGKNSSNLSM